MGDDACVCLVGLVSEIKNKREKVTLNLYTLFQLVVRFEFVWDSKPQT